jgi:hypothetical protein
MNLEEIKEVSRLLMRANEANPDLNTSQAVATSILLALLARARTGSGQAVEVTITTAGPLARCPTSNATGSMRFIVSTQQVRAGSSSPVC